MIAGVWDTSYMEFFSPNTGFAAFYAMSGDGLPSYSGWDFNGDGFRDFEVRSSTWGGTTPTSDFSFYGYSNWGIQFGAFQPIFYNYGDTIPLNLGFWGPASFNWFWSVYAPYFTGISEDSLDKYLPIRIYENGNWRYGWMEVSIDVDPDSSSYIYQAIFSIKNLALGTDSILVNKVEPRKSESLIYPNPFTSVIHIHWDQPAISGFQIFDPAGKKIYQSDNAQLVSGEILELNLSHLPNGLYFLRTEFDDGTTETQKIIKN